MSESRNIISLIGERQDVTQFRKKHWIGTFDEYLDIVRQNPRVARNAYERVYDMINSCGSHTYEVTRGEPRTHYRFFDDPEEEGKDAVFGLDESLESLVNSLKSAAKGYGTKMSPHR